MWKQYLKDYFNFTARERKGIFMLMALIVLVNLFRYSYPYFRERYQSPSSHDFTVVALEADTVRQDFRDNKNLKPLAASAGYAPFYFDPNLISTEEWMELGVREKTARTIQNYLAKGGRFRSAEDLHKIYGLPVGVAEKLKPFVRIKSEEKSTYPREVVWKHDNRQFQPVKQKEKNFDIDINKADSVGWVNLPGIGERLAKRILTFRERLGGFYSVDQVAETYFLPDSTFQKIRPYLSVERESVRKININTEGFERLSAHPYINRNMANAIVEFRKQHGNYTLVEDLKKIRIVNEETFGKIEPYLTVHD